MKKWTVRFCLLFATVFVAGELIGRYMGLNRLSLYKKDNDYEYIPLPNQNTIVYRNKYQTNEFSMRSKPLSESDSAVVLLIGDSIIYGGNSTDQDSLASTILEKELSQTLRKKIRVLNISAQSWGPDNGAAYVKKHGDFNAKFIILVYSSHDAHDNMTFKTDIGNAPYYDKNQMLAWQTIVDKGWSTVSGFFETKKKNKKELLINEETEFNSGFKYFKTLSEKEGIELLVYLHSELEEIQENNYTKNGIEIIKFCEENHIPLIKGIREEKPDLYSDQIHLNNKGQRFLSRVLYPFILEKFK